MNWYVIGNASRTIILEVICDKHMMRSPAYPKEIGESTEIFHGLVVTKISDEKMNGFISLCGLKEHPEVFKCDWCQRETQSWGRAR